MPGRSTLVAAMLPLALALGACSGGASITPVPTSTPPSTVPTEAPTEQPSQAAGATIEAAAVGTVGTVLIAGTNQMTLYIFTQDVRDSGTSACTGECLAAWPALTVDAGETPSAGEGITGMLGTITRPDDGSLQVTYNGLPLYFYVGDTASGDATGVYEFWEVVAP